MSKRARHVRLPPRLNDSGALSLVEDLKSAALDEAVELSFEGLEWAYPFGIVVCAEALRAFLEDRRLRGLQTTVDTAAIDNVAYGEAASYLRHVGFFQYCTVDCGNAPGEAAGSNKYLPLTPIRKADFRTIRDSKQLNAAIRKRSLALAQMILEREEAQDLLAYCFTEIIRNTFEHGETEICTVMAQRYGDRRVEIAVADRGRGIYASLREGYPELSRGSALVRAIEPGVSRSRALGERGNEVNAGFGLFVLSQLGREFGEFGLWSESQLLLLSDQQILRTVPEFSGTAVKIRVDLKDAEYFSNWLHDTVLKGEEHLPMDAIRADGDSKSRHPK